MILLYSKKDDLYKSVRRYLKYIKKENIEEYHIEKFYKLTLNYKTEFEENIFFVLNYRHREFTKNKNNIVDETSGSEPFVQYTYSAILNNFIINEIKFSRLFFFGIRRIIKNNPQNYYESFLKRINSCEDNGIVNGIVVEIKSLVKLKQLKNIHDPNFVYAH